MNPFRRGVGGGVISIRRRDFFRKHTREYIGVRSGGGGGCYSPLEFFKYPFSGKNISCNIRANTLDFRANNGENNWPQLPPNRNWSRTPTREHKDLDIATSIGPVSATGCSHGPAPFGENRLLVCFLYNLYGTALSESVCDRVVYTDSQKSGDLC